MNYDDELDDDLNTDDDVGEDEFDDLDGLDPILLEALRDEEEFDEDGDLDDLPDGMRRIDPDASEYDAEGFRITPTPTLEETLNALRETAAGIPSTVLYYGLSNLQPEAMPVLTPVWDSLPEGRRHQVIHALTEASETNFELNYQQVGRIALADPDPFVREAAIGLLWEEDSLEFLEQLMTIVIDDAETSVRAAAMSALGKYIMLGEYGEIPQEVFDRAQNLALSAWKNPQEPLELRRRALESIANSTHDAVDGAIRSAYASNERQMRVSALFAMGRTCDEQWADTVVREMNSDDTEMRYEAVRAAGEIQVEAALPLLKGVVFEDDVELRDIAIWSLGEIGGEQAVDTLNLLARSAKQSEDDDLFETIEDAIATASMGGDMYMLRLDDE